MLTIESYKDIYSVTRVAQSVFVRGFVLEGSSRVLDSPQGWIRRVGRGV